MLSRAESPPLRAPTLSATPPPPTPAPIFTASRATKPERLGFRSDGDTFFYRTRLDHVFVDSADSIVLGSLPHCGRSSVRHLHAPPAFRNSVIESGCET